MTSQLFQLVATAEGVVTTDDPINHPIPTADEATNPEDAP